MNFLESALKPKTSLWFYILTIIVALVAANLIGVIPMTVVMFYKAYQIGMAPIDALQNMSNWSAFGMSSNLYLLLMLIPFTVALIVMLPLFKAFNRRSFSEIINGTKSIRWARIGWGAGVWGIVSLAALSVGYIIEPENMVLQFDASAFFVLMLITIVFIPIQTTFEEVAFRGYLAQGIAGATRSRIWALIIPSIIFGLMHSMNPEVAKYGFALMMPQYIFYGLLFGAIAILDDGIELSMGIHAANNVFLSLFLTHSDSALQTNAVFRALDVDPVTSLFELLVLGVLVFIFFYKKYKWNFNILSKKVEIESSNDNESI